MNPADIRITAEPIDSERCKFLVSEQLYAGGVRRFASAEDAAGSPLAEAIFAIPGAGIVELIVSSNLVTVVKRSPIPWPALGKQIGAAIRGAFAADAPTVAPRHESGAVPVDDDALYDQVAEVFEQQVNPMVGRHGGSVELIDVQDGVVMLRLGGGCQGCGMADVTLRQGIEGMLRQHVPAVRGVVDVTDHTAGSNPYFASAKK